MKFRFQTAVLLGFLCALPVAARAQTSPVSTPSAKTPLTVQTAVAQTPEAVVARYTAAIKRGDWSSAAALMHPDALLQLKRMFRPLVFAATDARIGPSFFRVANQAQFDRLSGAQAYARLMESATGMNPDLSEAMATSQSKILGHVMEGADTAHVVYRLTVKTEGITVTKLGVMPLKRMGKTWGGLLTGDIEGMAAAFAGMAARPAPKPKAKPAVKARRR